MALPMLSCNRCGYKWQPTTANPLTCPKCRNRYWNKKRKMKYKTKTSVEPDTIDEDIVAVQQMEGMKI